MQNTIYIWKPNALTPLDVIEKYREKYPEYKNQTISYAGRLDPMAEGILVLLVGDENKNREKYLALNKEYEAEIIFGIGTDSFDSLGLIKKINFKEVSKNDVLKNLKTFLGKQRQVYPTFSSKAVEGKPLFWWTRQGKIDEINIPDREIEIYSIDLLKFEEIRVYELVNNIINQIKKVKGDFRQDEICKAWIKLESENKNKKLIKIKIKVSCSSGTYIRKIAEDLGQRIGSFAFAYSIRRTSLGEISENDALKII